MFSNRSFIILPPTFRFWIHIELILYIMWDKNSTSFISIWIPHFFKTICLKSSSFPIELLWIPWQKSVDHKLKVYFWILTSILLICICISKSPDYCEFVLGFEIRKSESNTFILPFQDSLAVKGFFQLYKNFRTNFPLSNKGHWVMDKDYTRCVDCSRGYCHLYKSSKMWTWDVFASLKSSNCFQWYCIVWLHKILPPRRNSFETILFFLMESDILCKW